MLGVARDTRSALAVLDAALADIGPADSAVRTLPHAELAAALGAGLSTAAARPLNARNRPPV